MLNIRKGLFETNSSNVYVLVIPKDQAIHILKSVRLSFNDYGWSDGIEYDTLNYLYQACVDKVNRNLINFSHT